MFGFRIVRDSTLQRLRRNLLALDAALDHVGVHPAEQVKVRETETHFLRSIPLTAENVLLRLAEERDAFKRMLEDNNESSDGLIADLRDVDARREIAERNLAYEQQGRSADHAGYAEALRTAGRQKGELSLRLAAANRELNEVLDLLEARGLIEPVADGAKVDLWTVVSGVLDRLQGEEVTLAMMDAGYDATRLDDGTPQFAGGGFCLGHAAKIYAAMRAAVGATNA